MTIWRMRIACWVTKATDTLSQYVTFTAFPLQQWVHECASLLGYTYTDCLDVGLLKIRPCFLISMLCNLILVIGAACHGSFILRGIISLIIRGDK